MNHPLYDCGLQFAPLSSFMKNYGRRDWWRISTKDVTAPLELLDQRRIQLCEKFAKSCLKSSHTSTMFPVNVQYNHDRIQKKSENYKVQFARQCLTFGQIFFSRRPLSQAKGEKQPFFGWKLANLTPRCEESTVIRGNCDQNLYSF